jgi:hypothetical protein
MEISTKNSAKCTILQSNSCNNFSSLMYMYVCIYVLALGLPPVVFQNFGLVNYDPELLTKLGWKFCISSAPEFELQ